jgi:hypothetical protein
MSQDPPVAQQSSASEVGQVSTIAPLRGSRSLVNPYTPTPHVLLPRTRYQKPSPVGGVESSSTLEPTRAEARQVSDVPVPTGSSVTRPRATVYSVSDPHSYLFVHQPI